MRRALYAVLKAYHASYAKQFTVPLVFHAFPISRRLSGSMWRIWPNTAAVLCYRRPQKQTITPTLTPTSPGTYIHREPHPDTHAMFRKKKTEGEDVSKVNDV